MSLQSVRDWLARHAPDLAVIETAESCATVADAARALSVDEAQIAKTLAVRAGTAFLLVTRGDARLDNAKCKARFGTRPRMIGAEETEALTGHPLGGVCPFGLAQAVPIYLDVSLRGHATVYPAGGSRNASVRVDLDRLFELVATDWVDLCRVPEAGGIERAG